MAARHIATASPLSQPFTRDNVRDWLSRFAPDAEDLAKLLRESLTPCVITLSSYQTILRLLKQEPDLIRELGPEALEAFPRERLETMGFVCTSIGPVRRPDGGIDLLACPIEPAPFPYLLAIQVKSHRNRQSSSGELRSFLGAIAGKAIADGVLITNTTFSMDTRWLAEQHRHLLRLRDVDDLRRWIHDDFAFREFWREIPATLELRPGPTINVHDALSRGPRSQ